MADISKLTVGGSTYNIKDTTARDWASSAISMISDIQGAGVNYSVAASLPTAGETYKGWIYLIPDSSGSGQNIKDEYICVQSGTSWVWEQIGTTATDLTNYISGTLSDITIASASHRHTVPALNTISYTPAGSVSISMTTQSSWSLTASTTQSAVTASFTGSYTPAGTIAVDSTASTTSVSATVSGSYDKTTGGSFTYTSTAADITNTKTAADVTGASYTPAGTISASTASTAGAGVLVSIVASTGETLGDTQYGAPTISSSTKASALTSATLQYSYDSANENLTFGSGTSVVALSITSANCFTAFTLSQGTATMKAFTTTTSYISFVGTAATITPAVSYSKATGVSYAKATDFTLSYTSTALTLEGTINVPAYKFTGTAATITTSGTYSKVSVVKYDVDTISEATFSGTAATLTPTYSTAQSATTYTNYQNTGASGTVSGVKGVVPPTT